MTEKIKIEFFHDVVCSFCFPMSDTMRKIDEEFDNIEIIHRSFALSPNVESYEERWGSREAATKEVVGHWIQAQKTNEDVKFNPEGMLESGNLMPASKDLLKAAIAAGIQNRYWDMFDGLQSALFTNNRDLNDFEEIKNVAKEIGLDVDQWEQDFNSRETAQQLMEDLQLSNAYGIQSVPTLIIDQKYAIPGSQSFETIKGALNSLMKQ